MKIARDTLQLVVSAMRQAAATVDTPQTGTDDTFTLDLGDVTLFFSRAEKLIFRGLVFRVFDREFFVTEEADITLLDGAGNARELTDETFGRTLEQFLIWRMAALQQFGL